MTKLTTKILPACIIFLLSVTIDAVELDWDVNTWPAPIAGVPTLSQTYAIGGGNVTVTIAGDTGALTTAATGTAASPQTNARNTGGINPAENSLLLRMDFPEGTPAVDEQAVTVTYTFSHPGGVNIPQFDVFDVDSSGSNQFTDIAIATGTLAAGGTINPTNIISGTANSNNGVNTATGTGGSGSTSNAGNVSFVFGQSGVNSFTFTYRNSAPNTAGSHLQAASIHDISFFVAPTVDKVFSPNVITSGGVSTLTITLSNNEATNAILSADLIDTLPAGMIIASPANIGGSCPGATNAPVGGNAITYPNGSVIPTGSCTISVDVTSTTPGIFTNTIDVGDLQTNFGLNTIATSDDITVNAGGGAPSCPVGTTLISQTGNADIATGAGSTTNPAQATGTLLPIGTAPNNGNSARVRSNINSTLILDLTDTIPTNSDVEISISRGNNSGNALIEESIDGINFTGGQNFNAAPNNSLQRINYTIASTNGARYLRFTRQGGNVWIDGVEYSQICQTPITSDLSITKNDGSLSYTPGGTGTYIIVVTNSGPDDVTGATIVDDLPNGVTMTSAWSCTPSSVNSTCNTLPSTTDPISIDVDIVDGDSITISVPVQFSSNMNDY